MINLEAFRLGMALRRCMQIGSTEEVISLTSFV